MDELLGRRVPYSAEAEQAVLGSMLIDPRCIADVIGRVKAEDFYVQANREIFETYLWQMCEQIVSLYIEAVLDGRQIKETDRLMIVQYLKAVSFGVISEWLQAGLGEDIRLFFDRIYDLKKGTVEEMLRRFETV